MFENFIRKTLYIFLIIARAVFFFMIIGTPLSMFYYENNYFNPISIWSIFFSMFYMFNYFNVARYLLRIVKSCEDTPFTKDSVKSFRIMGISLFINSIVECITTYHGSQNLGNLQIFANDSGAITPVMIICVVSALMCFVVADAFSAAVRIKEENDLTI